MKHRIISILTALTLTAALAGCRNTPADTSPQQTTAPREEEQIVQLAMTRSEDEEGQAEQCVQAVKDLVGDETGTGIPSDMIDGQLGLSQAFYWQTWDTVGADSSCFFFILDDTNVLGVVSPGGHVVFTQEHSKLKNALSAAYLDGTPVAVLSKGETDQYYVSDEEFLVEPIGEAPDLSALGYETQAIRQIYLCS